MPTKKAPVKTREQQMAERRAELDHMAQMEAQWQAERAELEREHNEFAQRAQAYHDAIDTHIKRSWAQRSDEPLPTAEFYRARAEIEQAAYAQVKVDIKPLEQLYAEQAAQERAAEAAAEAARLAAITPRQTYLSTLSFAERERIGKWESVNKRPFPIAGLDET